MASNAELQAKIEELNQKLIESEGRNTDMTEQLNAANQTIEHLRNEKAELEAKVPGLEAKVQKLEKAGPEGSNAELTGLRAQLKEANEKLADVTAKLGAKNAKAGQFIVTSPIKEDGKRYQVGQLYTGSRASVHIANGSLRVVE